MFKKVLVANRGEIAVRVIRTLKEMGIKSVAIYSSADADSLHVKLADEAISVGGPKSKDSYLNMKNILSAALLTGAEAIHPGYGFLSENELFVEMVEAVGLKWIGPSPHVIELMGNKANARESMRAAGVPVIPGSEGFIRDANEAKLVADRVGYPLLLKAAAGGGGKGMRFVYSEDELADKFDDAQREAKAAFGDEHMYVEKVMENVRHIEMQVMRDQFGHVLYFPERNCSLQRNNQKVMEESPALGVTPAMRENLGDIATKAVNALQYENTGTLEFLQDHDGHFYFMEMNTRIQVEHPVTEMVTGVDLIRMQIEVAAGEPLKVSQSDIALKGHALEVRLNAEQPAKNFAPSAGTIDFAFLPTGGPGIRIDSAIYTGDKIQPFYDSMIGKLLVHADNRLEAVTKMDRILDELVIQGVNTNADFQKALLHDPTVARGMFDTRYLEKEFLPRWQASLPATD
ncbi:acetyl-CoA carboxylase biotin carboxylase subunit [Weissella cibaria]|uniref:acetyl-CoA carboxylase biotin carboxylase subunit n=1 Tax=Weissella cibaria TaxID=137591 RepID=UPI000BFF8D4C|nr:acetyl-CoA carboxylase biotin carboxylase subunit [Weissella cibaria]MBZ6070242.1 acetyl-CoA carboxylase biotin carboxylase subunit [Weissella cibaria]MCC6123169.1 acetyl-CoA carboxylase biotin carboxylase subunit [Weissella cibaria]MCS8562007.1 acetyl-CoA carboxylase biotin carboxylase subunit [Weissella cibaria]MCS8566445.1 acetyl-CoA carboxylase biotin carboxylase subunit [Weissella cibaria]MCS8576254.1 acetyl-CoA carboxylase biotin carboxylase subunit [Weissella cibaria]